MRLVPSGQKGTSCPWLWRVMRKPWAADTEPGRPGGPCGPSEPGGPGYPRWPTIREQTWIRNWTKFKLVCLFLACRMLLLPGCPAGPLSPFLPGAPLKPGGPSGPESPGSPGWPESRTWQQLVEEQTANLREIDKKKKSGNQLIKREEEITINKPGSPSRPGGPTGPRPPGNPWGPGGPCSPLTTIGAGATPGSPGRPGGWTFRRIISSLDQINNKCWCWTQPRVSVVKVKHYL